MGRGVGVVIRAPLVDLGRDPRWGRTEESSGEDPYLVSKLAEGYIAGLHGDDPKYLLAASTLKHWLGNNNETNRNTSSSDFDERNLREYYAVPFEHAIRVSKAQGIMEAYNKINGEPSATTVAAQVAGDRRMGLRRRVVHRRVRAVDAGREPEGLPRLPDRDRRHRQGGDAADPAGPGRLPRPHHQRLHAGADDHRGHGRGAARQPARPLPRRRSRSA